MDNLRLQLVDDTILLVMDRKSGKCLFQMTGELGDTAETIFNRWREQQEANGECPCCVIERRRQELGLKDDPYGPSVLLPYQKQLLEQMKARRSLYDKLAGSDELHIDYSWIREQGEPIRPAPAPESEIEVPDWLKD